LAPQVLSKSGAAPRAGELAHESLSVRALTELAVLTAEQGDGERALSLLAAAEGQARAPALSGEIREAQLLLVAVKADEVGLRLFERRRWDQAILAHDFAASLHHSAKRDNEFTRSMILADSSRRAKSRENENAL
jgi:hypothetical protein